jgi:hypothetical protein
VCKYPSGNYNYELPGFWSQWLCIAYCDSVTQILLQVELAIGTVSCLCPTDAPHAYARIRPPKSS